MRVPIHWPGTGEEVEAAAEEASQGSAPPAATKKRKVAADGQAEASGSAAITESASGHLEGHLHCVSSACWPTQGSLYSGGWDHSVRGVGVRAFVLLMICSCWCGGRSGLSSSWLCLMCDGWGYYTMPLFRGVGQGVTDAAIPRTPSA